MGRRESLPNLCYVYRKCEFVEYMMPLIIIVGTILLLAILGLVLRSGKGAFLIAGYNTASKEEKEKTDEKKLCKAVGNLFLILAVCCIVPAAGLITEKVVILLIGVALIAVVCVIGAVYMNNDDRFRK